MCILNDNFRFKLASFVFLCLSLFPFTSYSYDFMVDGLAYNFNSDDNTVTLASDYSDPHYQSIEPNLIVPEEVFYNGKNYLVTAIGINAFKGCTQLQSVVIGNSVKTIMDGAFWMCSELTLVCLGDSLVSIGQNAFSNCSNLISVDIPNSVVSIGASVFYGCRKLSSIIIPNLVTSIGDDSFYRCDSLKSVIIGESVKSIGRSAFGYCTKLKSLKIPDCVEVIGDKAFTDCYGLEDATIGKSVTSIGELAFDFCEKLKVLKFNAIECAQFPSTGFTSNEKNRVFPDCPIERIEFGDSVKHVPGFFAAWITTAKTIVLSKSVISIGQYAFGRCESLVSIIIPDSMEMIAKCAFYGCKGLETITTPIENPSQISLGEGVFEFVSTQNCILKVPKGSVDSYKSARQWRDFLNIEEIQEPILGDVNNDGIVDVTDVNEVVNIILGKILDTNSNTFADTNGDGKVDVTDVNNIVNIILGKTAIVENSVNDTFEFIDKDGNVMSNGTTLNLTEVTAEEDIFTGSIINRMSANIKVRNKISEYRAMRINMTIDRMDNGIYQLCFPMACKVYNQIGNYVTSEGMLSASETRDLMTEWLPESTGECFVRMTIEVLNVSGSITSPTYSYLGDGPTITLEYRNSCN